jgi:predicted nucleotidyltransferase
MRRDEALRLLAEHRDELAAMGAGSLSLFGSVARDEAGPDSDVDILIDLNRPLGYFGLAAIHLRLEEILGRRVELVTLNALHERYRTAILPDLVHAT